jgi:acetolactate synthase-1/2/3 large subunit
MATVAKLIIETLVAHGIDRVFCVPGESYLGLLDALYGRNDIDTVVCRHESGAGFMALADARLTGRPGIAMVSRGPGASNVPSPCIPHSRTAYLSSSLSGKSPLVT